MTLYRINIWIFAFLLLSPVQLSGQHLLREGKTWNDLKIILTTCYCTYYETHHYYIKGDTTLNHKKYYKIYDSTYSEDDYGNEVITESFKGFIREDTLKKEVFYKHSVTDNETILYDFGMKVDSTITINATTYQVTNIDTLKYQGINRKVLTLSYDYETMTWIQGIGSDKGLFYPDYYNSLLLCAHQKQELLYKNDRGYNCVYYDIVDDINQHTTKHNLVQPKPASDYIEIHSKKPIQRIKIYSLSGVCMYSSNPYTYTKRIDLKHLRPGIYILQINDKTERLIFE